MCKNKNFDEPEPATQHRDGQVPDAGAVSRTESLRVEVLWPRLRVVLRLSHELGPAQPGLNPWWSTTGHHRSISIRRICLPALLPRLLLLAASVVVAALPVTVVAFASTLLSLFGASSRLHARAFKQTGKSIMACENG